MARTLTLTTACAALTLALGLASGAAQAAPNATVVIHTGAQPGYVVPPPPAPRYERVPAARRGMVWSQGHWEWRGGRHVWVPGQWMRVRQGQHYVQPGWHQRNGQWVYAAGRWDRDGDGVPNRHDRRPNNPYRH